jgi:hypothetical protein
MRGDEHEDEGRDEEEHEREAQAPRVTSTPWRRSSLRVAIDHDSDSVGLLIVWDVMIALVTRLARRPDAHAL